MGNIIDGRKVASTITEKIQDKILKLKEKGVKIPVVASILVGNDGGSVFYINNQGKVAEKLGVNFEKHMLEENTTEAELISLIDTLNNRAEVSGIIVQLPLPKRINAQEVISTISPSKDIDCLTYVNQGKLYMGEKTHIPCTPNSVITLLKSLNINLEGMNVTVVGRSNIVGKPLANLLLRENCTVTVCHSKTKKLKEVCSNADILISAIGKPLFIDNDFVKEGAIVIDVGTSSVNGKITGDVDFNAVSEKAGFITPVPGGVGALTTTLLLKNACEEILNYEA